MQYLLLIYNTEGNGPQPGEPEFGDLMSDYFAFTNEVKERGLFLAGQPLESVSTATTVRVREGKPEISDGPFAETKETLGGYYLPDCRDLDEALDCAARIPTARYGSIEVRPILQMPDEGST